MTRTVCLLLLTCPVWAQNVTFSADRPGTLPPGWTVAMTHPGGAPKWEVVRDDSAPGRPNVFAQTSTDKTSARFPLAIWRDAVIANGAVSVRFRTVSGDGDQAAGLVWRYRDPDNYYVVRANALEDNVVLYKVAGGQRTALDPKGLPPKSYGVKHPVPKLTWSTLRVAFDGARFAVFFNGVRIMQAEDGTFAAPGRTGLWTKADSVTWFDDFRVEEKK